MAGRSVWLVGRVFTGRRFVEAIVCEDGRVTAVGTRRSTRRHRPQGAERVEIRSRLAVPGLVDAHVHPTHLALNARGVDLHGTRSIAELVARTEAWAARHPRGPVVGRGWDQEQLGDHRYPTARDLERIPGGRPVVLFRVCSHAAVVNQTALDRSGLSSRGPDPAGGRIGRTADGLPSGLLFEEALRPFDPLVEEAVLGWPGALSDVVRQALRVGLTTLAPMNAGPSELRWGFERAADRSLRVRLRYYGRLRSVAELSKFRAPRAPRWVQLRGVKAVMDGSFGARTARLRQPYADGPDERGVALWTMPSLVEALQRASELGLSPALHAIGDAALDEVLTLAEAHPEFGPFRVEHASLTPPDLLDRLARIRPDLVVQPGFVAHDTWIQQRLGDDRASWTYLYRSLLDRGLRLAGSSDAPVEALDPLAGIRAAVRRAPFRRAFESSTPDERVTWTEAIRMYTREAGAVLGDESVGTLEVGSYADWTVLRGTSLSVALGGKASRVLETWVDGEQQYAAHPGRAGRSGGS